MAYVCPNLIPDSKPPDPPKAGVTSVTPERIDFNTSGYSVYADANGVHMWFGDDTLQNLCDGTYAMREFHRAIGILPAGDNNSVPGPRCTGPATKYVDDTLEVTWARASWTYYKDGTTTQCGVINDSQALVTMCDTIVKWCKDNFNIAPGVE
jgi:hypothetical protein